MACAIQNKQKTNSTELRKPGTHNKQQNHITTLSCALHGCTINVEMMPVKQLQNTSLPVIETLIAVLSGTMLLSHLQLNPCCHKAFQFHCVSSENAPRSFCNTESQSRLPQGRLRLQMQDLISSAPVRMNWRARRFPFLESIGVLLACGPWDPRSKNHRASNLLFLRDLAKRI